VVATIVVTSEALPVSASPASVETLSDSVSTTEVLPSGPSSGRAEATQTLLALDVLLAIPVELEYRGGYDRNFFAVWSDLDHDGCDTREEVLIDESLSPEHADIGECSVAFDAWYSTYDAQTLVSSTDIDIDHVVSLKEAWDSGAWAWSVERRVAYGNDLTDPRSLAAVSTVSNSSKGDRDPSNWLPVDTAVCRFVSDWISIKARWTMSMDQSEWGRLRNILTEGCAGQAVDPWEEAPVAE
jgi:hypothetical protein